MSKRDEPSLEDRCRDLRGRLQAQREIIAEQLGPPEDQQGYPRSKLMKFLTRRPGVAITTIAELVALFAGARHGRAVTAALAISRIMRSGTFNGSRRKPGAQPHA